MRYVVRICLPNLSAKQCVLQLTNIYKRIFMVFDANTDASQQLANPGTLMTVFGRAGDTLRGMYGRKSLTEKLRTLDAMRMLVERVGAPLHTASPQVRSPLLRYIARELTFKCNLVRSWPPCRTASKNLI